MSYTIYYSDPAKNISPIIVEDGTRNVQSTSLTLIGRNYPGYGQAIAEDLVHLLENFAGTAPPNNPIEGQLWFDTSDPNNKKLKINDGGISNARWSPVNGIFQQPDQPVNVKPGDIWVDTAKQQLNFYNGSSFTLVGPNYSSSTRTGSYAETVTDTLGVEHNVVIQYVNDRAVEIISSTEFTPNPRIEGYNIIMPGTNVSSANVGTIEEPSYSKINGTAEAAYYLRTTAPTDQKIIADAFMRKDIDQRMTGRLSIAADSNSLVLGVDPTFIIERRSNQYEARFLNAYNNGKFSFDIAGSSKSILTIDGTNRRLTINDPLTEIRDSSNNSGLDVHGTLYVSSATSVESLTVRSTLSNIDTTSSNALYVEGGAGIVGTLMVRGEHILVGPLTVGPSPVIHPVNSSTSLIVPSRDNAFDMGDQNVRWRKVYGNIFQNAPGIPAQFIGIASSATYLASPSQFAVAGDFVSTPVNFVGGGIPVTITASLGAAAVTNKVSTSTTVGRDSIIIHSLSANNLYRQTKRDFLKDVNYFDANDNTFNVGFTTPSGSLVPIGTMLPYAGNLAPPGWLICDGSNINLDPKYQNLRDLIGKKYDPLNVNFLLPNLSTALLSGTTAINYIIKY